MSSLHKTIVLVAGWVAAACAAIWSSNAGMVAFFAAVATYIVVVEADGPQSDHCCVEAGCAERDDTPPNQGQDDDDE